MFDFLVKEHPALQRAIRRLIRNGFIFRIVNCNLFFSVLLLLFTFFSNATNYYVSNSGNDSNPGTSESSPWKTVEKVNASAFKAGDQILFRRGDIFYGSLTVKNSGTSGNPIVFSAYSTGAAPVITGFTSVTEWTNLGGNVWESSTAVSTLSTLNIVVIDGINTPMGRYPNSGYLTYESYVGNTSIKSSSLTGTPNWTGAEVVIRKNRWIIDRNPITSQSSGTLYYTSSSVYNGKNYFGFFIQNDPRTLDQQNEWYFNPSTKKILVYSISEPKDVKISSIEHLVELLYKDYIIINNIAFEGGNTSAILVGSCDNMVVSNVNIDFCYNGIFGPNYGQTSNNAIITNSTINHINNNGITLFEEFSSATVNYNTIRNCGMIPGMSGSGDGKAQGIFNFGDGFTALYNEIDHIGYIGIGSIGDNSTISNNFINYSCMVKDDGAGIYVGNAVSGADLSSNIVLNTIGNSEGTDTRYGVSKEAFGLYFDDYVNNSEMDSNTVANVGGGAGIYLHSTDYVKVTNNTVFNCEVGLLIGGNTIKNNTIQYNKFIAKNLPEENHWDNTDFSQLAMKLITDAKDIKSFGTFDYNYYARPIDDGDIINLQPNGETQTPGLYLQQNLAEWKTYSGQDANSQGSPIAISSENDLILEYNASKTPKTKSLSYPMIDVVGTKYATSVILHPYTSIVLMKDPNPVNTQKITTIEDISICEGSSYEGWTSTGEYQRVLTAVSGADSIVTTNLTVNPVYHVSENVIIYEDESYQGWSESGQFKRTLTALTGCDSIITTNLKKEQLQIQSINLYEGWNILSSYLIPSKLNMEDVFEHLILYNQLIEVQDENGNIYNEDVNGWNNNIEALQQTEGYKIKVNSSSVLQIEGYPISLPLNIELNKGWNIISFPYKGSVNAMEVIKPLIDAEILLKVQDERGNSIENWGNSIGWINGIGNFTSGEGYLVQVNEDFVLPILDVYEKSAFDFESELENQYFKVDYNGNGCSHMNINITGLVETNQQVGDEIAAFDGDICVGATKLKKTNINSNVISIRTSAKDKDANNGFTEGDAIELRFWDADKKEEVIYLTQTIDGDLTYQKQGSVFIQLKKKVELNDFEIIECDMYPNPAHDELILRFSQMPEKGISILFSDINGKILLKHEVKSLVENLDIQSLPPGFYLVKIVSGEIYKSKKLIINR